MEGNKQNTLELRSEDVTVGWICALSIEFAAAKLMLDTEMPTPPLADGDRNAYTLGYIASHGVVVTCLPQGTTGIKAAATVANDMSRSFTQLRFVLLVGIGAGAPDPNNTDPESDIRLGDVVVSKPQGISGGVLQYDFGKAMQSGEFQRTGSLNKPPPVLRAAIAKLEGTHFVDESAVSSILRSIFESRPRLQKRFGYPGEAADVLFEKDYEHVFPDQYHCQSCDQSFRVQRESRSSNAPVIHYGIIASANRVMRDALTREKMRKEDGVICFEMEAAGIMDDFPCLVIRGLCDYADSHKSNQWQPYAALTAAAYGKELLQTIPPSSVRGEATIQLISEKIEQLVENFNEHSGRQEIRYQDDQQRRCHRVFKTSEYENQKNSNPIAVQGTCQWVFEQSQYRSWRTSKGNDFIWLTADPGCGKSVLSRTLVDVHLPSLHSKSSQDLPRSATICYFFFKDNELQGSLSTALCALLHQLFDSQPMLISHASPAFNVNGERLQLEVNELWRILIRAAEDPKAQPIFCVIDALDECRDTDRHQLIRFLNEFHRNSSKNVGETGQLKWFVTSRPYRDIQDGFDEIVSSFPSIRIRGEEENDQIRSEINLVIAERMKELSQSLKLTKQKTLEITQQLLAMEHRTYLWLHLAIDDIKFTFRNSFRPAEEVILSLPSNVEAAYEKLLDRVTTKSARINVKTILAIIVGARQPLTIHEMAQALDIATLPRYPTSLSELTISADHIKGNIRQWCGLFVFINHDKLYLLHQTAKEFLLGHNDSGLAQSRMWKHCLRTAEVEQLMAEICILLLCLDDFDCGSLGLVGASWHQTTGSALYKFAAQYWAHYVRLVETNLDERIESRRRLLYDTSSKRVQRYMANYVPVGRQTFVWRENSGLDGITDVYLAAYHGHQLYIRRLPERDLWKVNKRNNRHRSPLEEAIDCRWLGTVQALLDMGANPNESSKNGTMMHFAGSVGDLEIIRMFFDREVHVDASAVEGETALSAAAAFGHEDAVRMLLDEGAKIHPEGKATKSIHDPIAVAAAGGHVGIVQLLLQRGATGPNLSRALELAASRGHTKVVLTLIAHGVAATDTALESAARRGSCDIVQLALASGASDISRALHAASSSGHPEVVQFLLQHSKDPPQ